MDLMLAHEAFIEAVADLGVIFVSKEGKDSHPHLLSADRSIEGYLLKYAKQERFEGNLGERVIIPTFGRLKMKKICLIGVGERKILKQDSIRRAGGFLIKAAKETKAKTVALSASAVFSPFHDEHPVCALAEGVLLAAYEFREHFGTSERSKKRSALESVTIIESEKKHIRLLQQGLDRARILSDATRLARDLVNTSPRQMCPADLVEAAKRLALGGNGISCHVIDRDGMERLGMGAALAVGEGSQHSPLFVHLVYRPKKKSKRTVAIIGKGVTFDSGGLSLKPADAMLNMKIDMGGAATVIGLFQALPQLDIRTEVHGLFVAVENMPSGTSYRPGDVVRAMNGMTIEIANTDAEGRVTMADAICYAIKKIGPDQILDIATLAGASITAVGDD
jgi:leucyl aminopeptidase